MNKAKILATLGPASSTCEIIDRLIEAGVSAFRLNFSHGTHDEHRELFELVRSCAEKRDRHIPIVQDLQGPKIRVDLEGRESVDLIDGQDIALTADEGTNAPDIVRVAYPPLCNDLKPGEPILLDDGKLILEAESIAPPLVKCRVRVGGKLLHRKGMNLPGTRTSLPPLTDKDKADLAVGLELGVDFVALSFVQCAHDIRLLRDEMDRLGRQVPIIAKLERPAAIDNLDEILDETDAVMVARGDLGIEIRVECVPVLQKRIIDMANRKGVTVITATQMLESMTETITPTRAEATDVANAIYDGTDVVMLSGETSVGKYPVEAVLTMQRIIREAESFPQAYTRSFTAFNSTTGDEDGTTAHLAAQASRDQDLEAICVHTQSGHTAQLVSKFRPKVGIYAFTPHAELVNRLNLLWGVTPVLFPVFKHSDELLEAMNAYLSEREIAAVGESVAVTFGAPISSQCPSNMLRLHQVSSLEIG